MYTDVMLLIAGGICLAIALVLLVLLLRSSKRSRMYRQLLKRDEEQTQILTQTIAKETSTRRRAAEGTTELLSQDADATELLRDSHINVDGLPSVSSYDLSAFDGKYQIKREIHGGGMSRVFLAQNTQLGNEWIIKFIPHAMGSLDSEENILKLLNHINLPKIVDIFRDEKGVYLVESFIEGFSLDKLLQTGQTFGQTTILRWGTQLAGVLDYLHSMKPAPVYHFDLKPSNVMLTHNDSLVLIDFGISRQGGEGQIAVTYAYAAPEQLKAAIPEKYKGLIASRFGTLPPERTLWQADGRTDIYSLGVILFELATGALPTQENRSALEQQVSPALSEIILKCLETDPMKRFETAGALAEALIKAEGAKAKMTQALFMRKVMAGATAASMLAAVGGFGGGGYLYSQELASVLELKPQQITVSLQQTSQITIEKSLPNGEIAYLDADNITWSQTGGDIVRLDGSRVQGINVGESEINGRYRSKEVSLTVRVVEPMDGMVDISQIYETDIRAAVLAGDGARDWRDGAMDSAAFVSPESIAAAESGAVYLTDSGALRKIEHNSVETIQYGPAYLSARTVRCDGDKPYVLTNYWEEDSQTYYGILSVQENGTDMLYRADAKYSAIEDFSVEDGMLYFIERNAGVGKVLLKTLDCESRELETLAELPEGTCALALGSRGDIYLCNAECGTLQRWDGDKLTNFAGIENDKAFIDGAAPQFYMPMRMVCDEGCLYVWDFNVIRRLTVEGSTVSDCITLAGAASPSFDDAFPRGTSEAYEVVFPNSAQTELAVVGGSVLLTNPKQAMIWEIG